MSISGGKKKGRIGRIVGYVLTLCATLELIIKVVSGIWSAAQIARWVAGAVNTLSSSMAWQLSLVLAVVGVFLIVVSHRAASVLTNLVGPGAPPIVRRSGVLAMIAAAGALVFGFVGGRHATRHAMTANVPPPTPEGTPPTLPGNFHQLPKTPPNKSHTSTTHHAPALGSSQAPSEDVSYQPSSPAAIAANKEPGTPTATDASYSEQAPSNEEPESSESSPERTSSTTIYENTSTTASTSSTSAESSASASSSVSVSGGDGSESSVDSSQSASSSGESSASSSASVNVSETSVSES
jgi:hypothetical protein